MKNPGCMNNRGSPPYASGRSSYQIQRFPNPPTAMMLTRLPHRPVFKFLRFYVSAYTCFQQLYWNNQDQGQYYGFQAPFSRFCDVL